jgi:hypothetical protein
MNKQQIVYAIDEEFGSADAEMAQRLLSLRQDPSPALVPRIRAIPTRPQRQRSQVPRWAWGLAAVTVLLTVLVSASPPIRAAIASLQETIGDVYLAITDRSPDTSDATIVEPELMSLQAARAAVPFDFGLPTQVPDGWLIEEQVRVNDLGGGPFVEILWANPGHGKISFSVWPAHQGDGAPISRLVGPDSFREIEIGGQPAVIVKGGWDHDSREWAWLEVTTLIWTVDDVLYTLATSSDEVSEADLVTMAESTR